MRRTWGASEQKIVAAKQEWKCAACATMLPASFELDHKTPLWDDGDDCYETNAQALCNPCHAAKSQRENIARRQQLHERRVAAIEQARRNNPLGDTGAENVPKPQPKRARKEPAVPITSPEYVDPLLDGDNPFLQYAYIKTR